MTELHIFLDESGDFGFKGHSSTRFILSFVFHDTQYDIAEKCQKIRELDYIHVGPLIRREEPYQDDDLETRTKIFRKFFSFFAGLPIRCKSFVYEKNGFKNSRELLEKKVRDDLMDFFSITNPYLASFDSIVIYYDRGLRIIGSLLEEALESSGLSYSFKDGVKASNYRLFQVADLITMIRLIESKISNEGMSPSESRIFEKPRRFKKHYLKTVEDKEL